MKPGPYPCLPDGFYSFSPGASGEGYLPVRATPSKQEVLVAVLPLSRSSVTYGKPSSLPVPECGQGAQATRVPPSLPEPGALATPGGSTFRQSLLRRQCPGSA